jgi:CDP-glucose 4,6-dehydratase
MRARLASVYAGRRVLITGHTGFKGSWLVAWLHKLGADIHTLSLEPSTKPSLFEAAKLASCCHHRVGDIRDLELVCEVVSAAQPDFVFHLAAQALVRLSYHEPVETIATNVLGTTHVLEAIRRLDRSCAAVIVTTDKCYENREWVHGYREVDAMGGHDPYSASKGAAELIVSSYRRSFFSAKSGENPAIRVASARAGNVVGGGDWAQDRLVPDLVRAIASDETLSLRNPNAIRPWQHVLEPLAGYLLLGMKLAGDDGSRYCEPWNFGPSPEETHSVGDFVKLLVNHWGQGRWQHHNDGSHPHEATLLRLSIEKACSRLQWRPLWKLDKTVQLVADWYKAYYSGVRGEELRALCNTQIEAYMDL